MLEHALVSLQFAPFFGRLVTFCGAIFLVSILLYFPLGDMCTPSLTDKHCHDVACL